LLFDRGAKRERERERERRWRIYMQFACMFFLNSQVFQGIVFWVNEWEKPLKGERAFALLGLDANTLSHRTMS
jgi:hypothetical protein